LRVKVMDAMDKQLIFVDAKTPAIDAVKLMVEKSVWSVLVKKSGKVVGIITERDYLRRCLAKGLDGKTIPAEKIMSSPLITIKPDAALGDALAMMTQKGVRRLYIMENNEVIGRITQRDLMQKTLEVFLELHSVSHMI
ncbi:MAG: cyclic nucleotide-binding/CBS domain-containing protein, partial [Candidatus Bathyarchaeia archaeon]